MLDFDFSTRCLDRSPAQKYKKPCQIRFNNACHNENKNTYQDSPGLNAPDFKRSLRDKLQDDPDISATQISTMRRCDLNKLCRDKHLDLEVPPPTKPLPPTPIRPPKKTSALPTTPYKKHDNDISVMKLPVTFRCNNINRSELSDLIQKYTNNTPEH